MEEFLEIVLERCASQQQLVVQLVLAQHAEKLHRSTQNNDKIIQNTRNKSNDYFESMQYRQDMRHIGHYHNRKNLACLYTLLRISQ